MSNIKFTNFSREAYFHANPAHKIAVDLAKQALETFKATWIAEKEVEKQRDAIAASIRYKIEQAKAKYGLSWGNYDQLPQEVQDDFAAQWKTFNDKYYPKGDREFDIQVREHRRKLNHIFHDAGIPIGSPYERLSPEEYEKKINNLHLSQHFIRISDAIRHSRRVLYTDNRKNDGLSDLHPSDFVAISGRTGTEIIQIDKITPSGQIHYVHSFTGAKGKYTQKQWAKLFEENNLNILCRDVAEEAIAFVKSADIGD